MTDELPIYTAEVAQLWCRPELADREMDTRLAEAFRSLLAMEVLKVGGNWSRQNDANIRQAVEKYEEYEAQIAVLEEDRDQLVKASTELLREIDAPIRDLIMVTLRRKKLREAIDDAMQTGEEM